MKTCSLIVLCSLLAAGCAHVEYPRTTFVSAPPAPPAPPLPAESLPTVRYPAVYKAYNVGRRIDPQNPNIMYEGGTFIMRETPDRWNLHPQPSSGVPKDLGVAVTNANYSPLPVTEELKLELNTQRQATRTVLEQAARLGQAVTNLVPAARQMTEQQQQVLRQLQNTDERLRLLEEKLRQTHATTATRSVSTNRTADDW